MTIGRIEQQRIASRFAIACFALLSFGQYSAAVEIDFNSSADLQDFNQISESFYTPFVYSSTGGVGGSGGLNVSRSHQATYKSQGYEISRFGDTVESSVMLKVEDPLSDSNLFGKLYFVGQNDLFSDIFAEALDARLRENASNVYIDLISWREGSGASYGTRIPKGSIQAGHWYQLRTKLTYIDSLRYAWRAEVNDFGPTGETLLGNVASHQTVAIAPTLLRNNETIYAGFAGSGGSTAIDNFTVDSGRLEIPTQSVQLEATFDVQATVGSVTNLTEGDTRLLVGNDGTLPAGNTGQAILEFSLDQLPRGARVVSANLDLDLNARLNTPKIRVSSYIGDGLASIPDVDDIRNVLNASYDIDSSEPTPLDAGYFVNYVDGSYIGIRVENLTPDNYFYLNTEESLFPSPNTTLTLEYFVPVDFNRDGSVDTADYTIWRDRLGTIAAEPFSPGDANGDGNVDDSDYRRWRSAYQPQTFLAAASSANQTTEVPEPMSMLMFFGMLLCGTTYRHTR